MPTEGLGGIYGDTCSTSKPVRKKNPAGEREKRRRGGGRETKRQNYSSERKGTETVKTKWIT